MSEAVWVFFLFLQVLKLPPQFKNIKIRVSAEYKVSVGVKHAGLHVSEIALDRQYCLTGNPSKADGQILTLKWSFAH